MVRKAIVIKRHIKAIAGNAAPSGTVKKVFKCPHCSFWASTASRFHVHIVGHLNKKPFECSLCAYRSNWRWDITKHIRLKSARDSGHERARVLMTDETGRRNYAKYNKYLAVVRLRDGSANQAPVRSGSAPTTKQSTDSPRTVEASPQLVVLAPRSVTAATLANALNVGSEKSVVTSTPLRQLLPAPPRLTPAPTAVTSPGPPPLTQAPLRPPPPLAPAVLPGPPRLHPAPKRSAPQAIVVVTSTTSAVTAATAVTVATAAAATGAATTTTTTTTSTVTTAADAADAADAAATAVTAATAATAAATTTAAAATTAATTTTTSNTTTTTTAADATAATAAAAASAAAAAAAAAASAVSDDAGAGAGETTSDSEPPAKKMNSESKRTLWKCKKCNYKDPQRDLVLAHVKQHYQHRAQASISNSAADTTNSVSESEASVAARFKCGHCGQVSHWKHVIQRHCRLKHDGNVHIVTAQKSPVDSMGILGKELHSNETPEQEEEERNETEVRGLLSEPLQCPTCPFTCLDPEDMNQHQQNHEPQQGAIFKCYLCPYYVALKTELHDHLQLHGVTEPEEHLSRTLQINKMSSGESSPDKLLNESDLGGDPCNSLKRYRCAGCPYVSNSKSQFLYHKQFHRPRGAPFKCGLCSYSVSRRHLLHQHLRVHGILIPPQKSPGRETEGEKSEQESMVDGEEEVASGGLRGEAPDLDTRQLPEVPLVWVSRNGRFDKLYKCRWCPHVNQRKANIMEHEKMHRRDEIDESPEADETVCPRLLPPHRCPLCNYGCHNAGVLSAHMKVHQGVYGTVRALVDHSRTDESQLEELGAASDSPPLLLPQNTDVNQGVEDGQEETLDFRIEPPFASDPPPSLEEEVPTDDAKLLMFCQQCPARFLVMKELTIHKRFHEMRLAHRCESCNYTARQRPHLLAHIKVHSDEYQERTESLASVYPISPSHPRPRTAVIVEGPGVSGPVWVVVSDGLSTDPAAPPESNDAEDLQDTPPPPPRPMNKQFSCSFCPAKFFKSVALEYHKTLHGGSGNYGCKYCDYRVKTYGNLVKHEMIHENSDGDLPPSPVLTSRTKQSTAVPLSGTDLFNQKAEVQKLTECGNSRLSTDLPVDPQFGTLMHGNPEFVYPMYLKNGRLKEKRYKCHKCPSAFEKREQYKVHLSLHGSKQRYKCETCDYSVKYYANFIQHQRKHQYSDQAHAARRAKESNTTVPVEEGDEASEDEFPKPVAVVPRSTKTIGSSPTNKQVLTVAEQQSRMLEEVRDRVSSGIRCDDERKTLFRCAHCPYASARRDGLESHAKRHAAVSGVIGAFACKHCDYSAPQLHFLREHVKLHFDAPRKLRPEAYTHLEKLTIWMEIPDKENQTHTVVFQDKGTTEDEFERFFPTLPIELKICEENSPEPCIFVDLRTGEPLSQAVPKAVVKANSDCEDRNDAVCEAGDKKKAPILKEESTNKEDVKGDGQNSENSRQGRGGGISSAASSNAEDEDAENNGRDNENDEDNGEDNDIANDRANQRRTIAGNESEEESRTSSKLEVMTRKRTARKVETHTENLSKRRKMCKDEEECASDTEISDDGEMDIGDEAQPLEDHSDTQKPEVPVPDDGESLSASSSCDSSSSNSSSGSSSSSSSSSSSESSSSSTSNGSKSSDSSSECDAEESDRVPTPPHPAASQDESLSSDT